MQNAYDDIRNHIKRIITFFWSNQLVIELIVLVVVMCCFYLYADKGNVVLDNLLLGLLSSLLLVVFFTFIQQVKDYYKYSYLYGEFFRIRFYEKRLNPVNNEKPYEENVSYYRSIENKYIDFLYRGAGTYSGAVEYKEGRISFELSVDSQVPSIGKGSYHYISKREVIGAKDDKILFGHSTRAIQELDFGTLSSLKYALNINYIILAHENVSPSGSAAGYELLVRKYDYDRSVRKIKRAINKTLKLKIRLSNSHDYTAPDQYMVIHPYFLAVEVATGDEVICCHIEQSLTDFRGFVEVSIPFISTIEIAKGEFKKENFDVDQAKFTITYP